MQKPINFKQKTLFDINFLHFFKFQQFLNVKICYFVGLLVLNGRKIWNEDSSENKLITQLK